MAVRDQDPTQVGLNGHYWLILDVERIVRGYAWVAARRWGPTLSVREVVLAPGGDLPGLIPALLRCLRDLGSSIPAVKPDAPPCTEINFHIGRTHPLHDLLGDTLAPRVEPPYAWYIRIPGLRAFLQHIAPALEERLARSILAGYTGDLKIDLYREGLQLRFEQGKLLGVEPWQAPVPDNETTESGCPPLTFPQLLLGYRGLDELRAIFPDVWVKDDKRLMIDILFPKQPSIVEPLS